jgi:hypothetical protein
MTYDIHMDVKYGPLEVVDAGQLVDACKVLMVEPKTVVPTGD